MYETDADSRHQQFNGYRETWKSEKSPIETKMYIGIVYLWNLCVAHLQMYEVLGYLH